MSEYTYDRDEFPRDLGRALTFITRQRNKYMNEQLKDYDMHGAMYQIVHYVNHHPGTSQDGIVSNLHIDKCTIARRTKKLEELGYIYRETDDSDRRQNKVYLTDKGSEIVPIIHDSLREWSSQISQKLDDNNKAELVRSLYTMIDTIKELGL